MKKMFLAAAAGLLLVNLGFAESVSLSHLFLPGKTILDLDGDGFVEKPALTIIVPDDATAAEMALAADIAARANLESLGLDLGLVRRASQAGNLDALPFPILIGTRLAWTREIMKGVGAGLGSLAPNQGAVFAFTRNGRGGIACVAGSEEALLRTGRAYFLRWPYLWEVWGRETGATFQSLEKDLAAFLDQAGAGAAATVVRQAVYEFPVTPQTSDALRALAFNQGQVKDLAVEVRFPDDKTRDKARRALLVLQADQRKGNRTAVLSTPACAALTFELWSGKSREDVTLARVGATKRLLTPSFRERPPADPPDKDFDLLSLLSTRGLYGDQDRDGINDALDAYVVIPASTPASSPGARPVKAEAVAELASRLMLSTAGGAFPVVLLDSEVQSRRTLAAPVLIGTNALTKDLVKTGKLKPPALASGWGLVQVVPKAFGKSNALALNAEDASGLESTLSYMARTYPYLDDYGEGHPELRDTAADLDRFLRGEKGAAEGFLYAGLAKAVEELKGKDLESVAAEVILPGPNSKFEAAVQSLVRGAAKSALIKSSVTSLRSGKTVFEKEKSFPWEGDDAAARIEAKLTTLNPGSKGSGLSISVGLSESPAVRAKVRSEIERLLEASGFRGASVEVLSAYKQGYFWLSEKILPQLKGKPVDRMIIRFSEEREDLTRPKRTYADPARWVQELYPVDEVLSRDLGLPLEKIEFEMKPPGGPVYEVQAYDGRGASLLESAFTPRTREIPLFDVLPEWGTARVTCGWLRVESGKAVVADEDIRTDLERFWDFYQQEVLKPLYAQIMKKTGQEPTFSKQPYFKRLGVEIWSSEPDFRTGLDEEVVSSLEALHDEIYFDTLDLLRGITRFDPEDKELAPDASRSSAPGNVFPVIHPSLEGGPTRVKVSLEDWPGQAPEAVLRWKEKGRDETTKRIAFPALKPKETRLVGLVWNGPAARIEDLLFEIAWEKEADYVAAIDLVEACREAERMGLVEDPFRYPGVANLTLRLKLPDREKEERLPVSAPQAAAAEAVPPAAAGGSIVPTREILSPAAAAGIIRRLSQFQVIRSYVGGRSYEGRDVPVLELYLPLGKYVSLPRLATFKPTLQVSARQHANEVSSTNYLLKYAELTARDPAAQEALKKVNLVFEPVENPDGAELAFELQKTEPFHSLHAGRYGSLGVDIGYQAGSKPLLPEAAVRTDLYAKWLPDIFLNLHGYPSHEWVQQFSNYTPYLFRDYWIPKGWFTYFRGLDLSVYGPWREAGEALKAMIAKELDADPRSHESNRKFYARYDRWAARWAPHLAPLEVIDGVTIFAKRRASTENRLTARARATFAEETPEVMDETATGDWLDFLCGQGLAYLRAHVKYLTQGGFETARIEEESQERVRITFIRARPVLPQRER